MKWRFLQYGLLFTLPMSAWIAFNTTGLWTYSSVILAFVLIPLSELILTPNQKNLNEAEEKIAQYNRRYDLLLYVNVILHWLLLIYFLVQMSDPTINTIDKIGMTCSMGILCGVTGINLAHELGHRTKSYEIWMALSLLLSSLYMHFYIEHNRGHHKNVATEGDPASARYGENLYRFWFRSLFGSYLGAWSLERSRLKSAGFPFISWQNEMIRYSFIQLSLLIAIGVFISVHSLLYFIGAALIGALLLESVNYIEHYGLSRNIKPSGRPERVLPHHSWNSDHVVGRMFLFELSRHSDHHYLASRPYQILRSHHEAPQMPTGYPGMMIIALIPPLWFRIMNNRLKTERKKAL